MMRRPISLPSATDDPAWAERERYEPRSRPGTARDVVLGRDVALRVLDCAEEARMVARLQQGGATFLIAPHVRFAGEPGEQHTAFVCDPSGNAIELKGFADASRLFATGES